MKNAQTAHAKDGLLAQVVVNKQNLLHNLHQYAESTDIAPVLKSNAYGHGLAAVANIIENKPEVPFVSLAAYREVERLRAAGNDIPALIIGYTPPAAIMENTLDDVHFAISSLQQLKVLSSNLNRRQDFHLKVETGMHRYGIKPDTLPKAFSLIEQNPDINLVGVFSHFSDAYTAENEHTHTQITRWNSTITKITQNHNIPYRHVAATSGHFYGDQVKDNLRRVGIGFYGITDYAADLDLMPALSFQSFVACLKTVASGQPIGYSQSFRASQDMQVAVIPVGYQEGVDRRLSNAGCVQIQDKMCPIVGKVSMNATIVDVTDVKNVTPGDAVEIYSADPDDPHSVLNQADTADTIPYDILTGISPELERSVV